MQQHGLLATHICHTVARLLNAVPNSSQLVIMIDDLIYLSKDLSALYESGLLERNADTTHVFAEVVLFEETTGLGDWSSRAQPKFTLRILNGDALLCLQSAVLLVLERFVAIRKERRLQQQQSDAEVVGLEELDRSYLIIGDPDLYFSNSLNAGYEGLRALLATLRQALLASVDPSAHGGLVLSLKQAAARVLLQLQADWHRTGAHSLAIVQEVAVLSARSAVDFLRTKSIVSASHTSLDSDLAYLVQSLILVPPSIQGSLTSSAVDNAIYGATFSVICDSFRYMKSSTGIVNDIQDETVTENDQALRRPLETVLLRTIHVMLHSLRSSGRRHDHGLDQLPSSLAFQMIWTHDAVRHLFRLLNDRALSDNAVWILSHLLCRIRLLEIEETAKLCVHMCHSQSQATEGDNTLRIISEIDGSSSTLRSKKRLSTHCALNGEIVTQPAFSGYMAVLNKRRKKDSGWTKRNTLSCLDDELLLCLILGLRSASSLRARLQGEESLGFNGITDGKHADSIFQEVVNVSSAIRLLLASAKNRCDSWNFFCHTLCPSLSQVVKDFLDTISIVSAAISAACKPNVEENPLIRVFGEAIVPCGMLVELFVSTTNSLQVPFLSKALSCIQSTRDVAQRLRMLPEFSRPSSNLCSAMPKALYETLHGLSIHRRACVNTRQPTLVCLFEEMLFSVTMGTVNGSSLSVVCAGPILLPVDIAVESQIKRLELLAVCRGEKDDPVANEATVEQKSFDAIKRADKAHPDPFVRLLLWQSLAWIVVAISPQDLRQTLVCQNKMGNCTEPHLTAGSKLVLFLIDVAFADPDPVVRDYSSRELGKILSVRNWTGVLALMSSNEEWQQLKSSEMCRGSTALAEQVTSRLFRHVDSMLHKLCSVPQSQLSFTVASAPKQANSPRRGTSTNTILSFRRAAARSLCSLCGNAPSHTNSGRILVEHAIIRVVRMWSGITASQRPEDAAVCFAELSRLSHCSTIGSLLREKYFATFAPALFRDMLVPSLSMVVGDAFEDFQMMPLGLKERQCDLLSNFLRAIFLNSWTRNSIPESLPSGDLLHECEACLPNVISQLVVEKDYDALKSITGYKLYLLAQKRLEYKQRTRNGTSYLERKPAIGLVVGESFNTPSSRQWCRNLEEQTRELCLAPGLIEQIIPQVFMRAGRDELLFFTRNVLQDKLTLKQLVTSRELPTLKNFVIELGRNPEMTCSVARAMKAAAIARNQDTGSASGTAASGDRVNGDDSLVTSWVTPHFMYLLVNVIQSKWTTKSIDLRIEVFRSLVAALDFLRPSEASQYLPQIMATVNSAVADEVETTHESLDSSSLRLRLLAVQVLKKFVKLVATTHWEVLGQNLTFVVVSLDPIFSKAEGVEDSKIEKDCRREAVALFECLTQGDLGIKLAPYFSEIPFLPPSSALDSVRASLRSLGVNFDNLQVATTQGTQDGKTRSTISDAGSSSGDSLGADSSAARQAALRRRLETVCPLLENENSRVRCVVLQHLTALLRANRELFHALVENEGMTSTKSYVTVAYRGKSGTFPFRFIGCSADLLMNTLLPSQGSTVGLSPKCWTSCFLDVFTRPSKRLVYFSQPALAKLEQ